VAATGIHGHAMEITSSSERSDRPMKDIVATIRRQDKIGSAVPYTLTMPGLAPEVAELPELGVCVQATPLVRVQLAADRPVVWCKAEYMHPSGSTKDRIAAHMLCHAWRRGRLKAGDWVAEASSGSTSIAMSMVCARLGLRFAAFMPEGVSQERVWMIAGYGGQVHLTPKAEGIVGALAACRAWAAAHGAFEPRQFENPENAQAHRCGTMREALRQLPGGRLDAYVSGVGTGGTLEGMRCAVQDAGLRVRAFAARPVAGSRGAGCDCFAAAEQCSFSSRIPGVLEGMSHLYRPDSFEHLEVIEVADEEALRVTRELIRLGHPVGPSSGLNVAAAMRAAERLPPGAVILSVLCDRMERYFSTELFSGWNLGGR
jgi:cysteine synthase A